MRCVTIRVRTRYKIFQKKKKRKRTFFFAPRENGGFFFSLLVIELGSYAKQHREQKKKGTKQCLASVSVFVCMFVCVFKVWKQQ